MKILQVITSLLPGGAEKIVTDLSLGLKDRSHEVDIVVFDGSDTPFKQRLKKNGCRVFYLGHSFFSPLNIPALRRMIADYDIVHSHNSSPQLFTAIAAYGKNIPIVTTEHNTTNRKRQHKLLAFVDRCMYKHYTHIVCISPLTRTLLLQHLGSCSTPCSVIPNGVDVASFHEASSKNISRDPNKTIITEVAGFRPQKDQDTLLRALALLPTNQFEVWLVGDGERRAILEELVHELHIEKAVKFWGLRDDIPQLLKASDIICMSSHYEGLSLSSIEGMSVGRPFVASDVNGLHEITEGAGLLFPHQDAQALATLLSQLASNPTFASDIAQRCYQRALQFDLQKMVDAYEALYRNILQ